VVDTLLAVLAVGVVAVVALSVLVAVTVAPFVVALAGAERRGCSAARAGAVALAGSAVALGLAVSLARSGRALPALATLAVAWVAPVVLARMRTTPAALGSRGRHERAQREGQ
jgi:hypothetical protein